MGGGVESTAPGAGDIGGGCIGGGGKPSGSSIISGTAMGGAGGIARIDGACWRKSTQAGSAEEVAAAAATAEAT